MALLSRENGGNMYIDLQCQSCDRAPITSTRGTRTGAINGEDACCGLWQTCPLLEFPTSRIFTISGWRLHYDVMSWFGQDTLSAITFRQPGICLARMVIYCICSQRNKSTTSHNKGVGIGPTLFVDISYNCGLVCSDHDLAAP